MKLNSLFYEEINSLFKALIIIHPGKPTDSSSGWFYCTAHCQSGAAHPPKHPSESIRDHVRLAAT